MKALFLSLLFLISLAGCTRDEVSQQERVEKLGKQLRCPVCRGVPIADSPAALAQEMMTVVRQQVSEGKSDEEILRFFEERYGEWALLQPKAEGMNLAIWILPALFFAGGAGTIAFQIRKRRRGSL